MSLANVDLPHPLGPTIEVKEPFLNSCLTFSKVGCLAPG